MNKSDKAQLYIILHILDAYRDASGQPGVHKVPLEGYDRPMDYETARRALTEISQARPDEDFSMRSVAPVLTLKH